MPPKPKASALDTNKDGKISAAEASAGSAMLGGLGYGDAPSAVDSTKGAPLLPYQVSDPTTLEGLSFQDQSMLGKATSQYTGKPQGRVAARYYEKDTLKPLGWSPELRAQLQRSLYQIGLYGKDKVTLGSWGAADQAAFSELLSQSNVDGREWFEQLAFWKAHPPQDLLQKIAGTEPNKPTFHVSNPVDIRAAAAQADQSTMGGGNLPFVQGAPAAYQPTEIAAQQAVTADQAAGGGGTVTDQASAPEFFADKARREHPVEVGGYSYLKAFDQFANFIRGGSSA